MNATRDRLRIDIPGLKFSQLPHLLQQLIGPMGFFFVNETDAKTDVCEDIIANLTLGHVRQTDLALDTAKVHLAHRDPVLLKDLDDLSRYR